MKKVSEQNYLVLHFPVLHFQRTRHRDNFRSAAKLMLQIV